MKIPKTRNLTYFSQYLEKLKSYKKMFQTKGTSFFMQNCTDAMEKQAPVWKKNEVHLKTTLKRLSYFPLKENNFCLKRFSLKCFV